MPHKRNVKGEKRVVKICQTDIIKNNANEDDPRKIRYIL